ncbi:M23 family metallopeptidase [Mycolicibacterium arseniciresistens]|uniref:M23 family metallopeptidase n=1 Tax=Mycolicibacterium arseniciresistens TaxID=3062257 RepID=A0ABT8UBQ3_9MYCO|nr:M23 family metallopeptidase [Mycolicibacterium arseniciresistens]MDO3634245.1 M23 family metallopeptidase [Mycolicibacterium arseniciresistens]
MDSVRSLIRRSLAPAVGAVLIVAAAGCADGDTPAAESQSPQETTAAAPRPDAITPLVGSVPFAPVPFAGSDGRTHMVYELAVTNFTGAPLTVDELKVLDDSTSAVLGELDAAALRDRMQPAGSRAGAEQLEPGQAATIFIHLILDGAADHTTLVHEVAVTGAAIPTERNRLTERIATTKVDERTLPVVSAPLRGERYIAADACCDAARHTRAVLPVNGRPFLAQRYAIDFEQADAQNRIFTGNPRDAAGYQIYGEEVLAVADGTVVGARSDLPEQTPGVYPAGIPIDEADGNFVVLDIGEGFFVNYAHMQPGSVRPKVGDRVTRGDVIGLVGNTGNSVAPHLHLHVMDGPSPLAAQGLPYLYDRFTLTGQVASTADFDASEGEGVPLVTVPGVDRAEHTDQLILDQNIVDFGS